MNGTRYEVETLEQTRLLLAEAAAHFRIDPPVPEVRFDLRGKSAGMVVFHHKRQPLIRYNQTLLQENGEAFIQRTVPHEVAHLVARELHGPSIKPHGKQWREIMAFFGADSSRCHNFPVGEHTRRRMRYFRYRCGCQNHQLSAIRHHRSLAGVSYLCRRCGSALRQLPSENS